MGNHTEVHKERIVLDGIDFFSPFTIEIYKKCNSRYNHEKLYAQH